MIALDYFLNFFENDHMHDTKSKPVIKKLKAHIARYGIPDYIVSNNSPQICVHWVSTFLTRLRVQTHQAKGKVEAAVKEAKKVLLKAKAASRDTYIALLNERNTPMEVYGTSPVWRFRFFFFSLLKCLFFQLLGHVVLWLNIVSFCYVLPRDVIV